MSTKKRSPRNRVMTIKPISITEDAGNLNRIRVNNMPPARPVYYSTQYQFSNNIDTL